nr:hypothetical protein [Leptospira santarosai]
MYKEVLGQVLSLFWFLSFFTLPNYFIHLGRVPFFIGMSKKETVTIEKKETTWPKKEESKEETPRDRYLALGSMSLLLILFLALP